MYLRVYQKENSKGTQILMLYSWEQIYKQKLKTKGTRDNIIKTKKVCCVKARRGFSWL